MQRKFKVRYMKGLLDLSFCGCGPGRCGCAFGRAQARRPRTRVHDDLFGARPKRILAKAAKTRLARGFARWRMARAAADAPFAFGQEALHGAILERVE